MSNELFSLQGRVALVTGGSRGIGKMIARGFIAQGAKVYITARKAGPCEATAAELSADGGTCIAIPIDISTVDGARKLAAAVIEREPKLDILVNNAGAAWATDFASFPEKGWDKVMNLNLKAPFFLSQALEGALKIGSHRGTAGQDHQHRLHRRDLCEPARDLLLRCEQGRAHSPDAPHGASLRIASRDGQRDRAGTVRIGHEHRRPRSK